MRYLLIILLLLPLASTAQLSGQYQSIKKKYNYEGQESIVLKNGGNYDYAMQACMSGSMSGYYSFAKDTITLICMHPNLGRIYDMYMIKATCGHYVFIPKSEDTSMALIDRHIRPFRKQLYYQNDSLVHFKDGERFVFYKKP